MKTAFLLFACFITTISTAQNLVKNPSFEQGAVCDGETENINAVEDWKAIAGSPRLIRPDCPLSKDAETYIQGMQIPPAYRGEVYAGMGMDKEGEFLQGSLEKPLKKGVEYWIKLRVRLPSRFCSLPIAEIGILFSAEEQKVTEEYRVINADALQLRPSGGKMIEKQYEWTEVSGFYTAKGDEKYVCIGNFAQSNVAVLAKRKQGECSYLFLDSLSVEEFKQIELPVFAAGMDLKGLERVWLKGLVWDSKGKMTKESGKYLKGLAAVCTANKYTNIEISGHTDNQADESVNMEYSTARAQQIVDYLQKKGVGGKITAVGKGSNENIAPNDSPANIAKNNRIEIRVF